MVDAVVQSVIDKAANAIVEEGFRLFNIQKNIESVQETMKSLQSHLEEIESKKIETPATKKLTIDIRDLAQDAEDMLDTYFAKIEPDSAKGPLGFLKRNSRILLNATTVRKMNQDSEDIKARADKLKTSKSQLKPESDAGARVVDTEVWSERRKFLLVGREPKEIVGRKETIDKIEGKMCDGNAKHCKIVTIIGPGGVGKTTVAKKIYQNLIKDESSHHCKRAMVYVSPEPDVDKILRDIAKQVGLGEDMMDEHLVKNLYLYLQDNRYVIFLDDVWNKRTWDQLKDALMINSENGSRLIVTSRDTLVGGYIHETALYNGVESIKFTLDVLSKNYAMDLFKDMIAGHNYDNEIKKPLKDIGEKIVEKCGGLPLAIEVVVGMLRGKQRTVPAWNEVLGKMSQIPENNCLKILALSYKELPPKLKPLFLYLGIFPENYEINVPQLIPLWIAEKFITDDGKQDDYVEQQINELSYRNLVQITGRKYEGRIKTCRLHSLVHDLCRRLAEENNYFCTRNNLRWSDVDPAKRRRVTTNTRELRKNAFQDVKIPKLRALFCFCKDEELFQFLKDNALDLQFLRVLIIEFGGGKIVKVPEEITNLSGLIYLKMIGNLSEIPESIRRLRRLQTLEIRSKDIPEGILKMRHVKHLFLSSSIVVKKPHNVTCSKSRDVEEGVQLDLPSIESLDIDFGPNFTLAPSSVKKLTSLKRLGLYVTKREMLGVVFPREPVLPNLEALKLKIYVSFFYEYDEYQIPKLDLSLHKHLKKLILYFDDSCDITGKVVFPPNIAKISLVRVTEMDKHMDALRKLPNLERIELKRCRADNLDFSAGEGNFPNLQSLILKETKLRELAIDEDGISKLDYFEYEPSPLSENAIIPEGLRKRNEWTNIYEEEV